MKVPEDFIELCDWAKECPDCAANEIWTLRSKLNNANSAAIDNQFIAEEWYAVATKLYDAIRTADKDHEDISKWLDVYDALEYYILMKERYND